MGRAGARLTSAPSESTPRPRRAPTELTPAASHCSGHASGRWAGRTHGPRRWSPAPRTGHAGDRPQPPCGQSDRRPAVDERSLAPVHDPALTASNRTVGGHRPRQRLRRDQEQIQQSLPRQLHLRHCERLGSTAVDVQRNRRAAVAAHRRRRRLDRDSRQMQQPLPAERSIVGRRRSAVAGHMQRVERAALAPDERSAHLPHRELQPRVRIRLLRLDETQLPRT